MAPGNYGDHKWIGILSIEIRFVFEVGNHGKVPYRFKADLWHAGCHWLRIRARSEHSVRLVSCDSSIVGGLHQWFISAGGWLQFSPRRLGGGGRLCQWRHDVTVWRQWRHQPSTIIPLVMSKAAANGLKVCPEPCINLPPQTKTWP